MPKGRQHRKADGDLQQKLLANTDQHELGDPGRAAGTCAPEGNESLILTTVMKVDGICCPAEVPIIRRLLEPLPGVLSVNVNVTAKGVWVEHGSQTSAEQVCAVRTLLVRGQRSDGTD